MPFWLAGICAGLIAGLVMAILAMWFTWLVGKGFLYPLRLTAGFVERNAALEGVTAPALGVVLHFGMSVLLGVFLAAILSGFSTPRLHSDAGQALVFGLIYALIIWAVNQFGILRLADPLMAERMPPVAFGLAHAIYGAVLGFLIIVLMNS
jgi:hypothetical protein